MWHNYDVIAETFFLFDFYTILRYDNFFVRSKIGIKSNS